METTPFIELIDKEGFGKNNIIDTQVKRAFDALAISAATFINRKAPKRKAPISFKLEGKDYRVYFKNKNIGNIDFLEVGQDIAAQFIFNSRIPNIKRLASKTPGCRLS